ncbi:hypothetical protein Xen7305DRAFT_00006180 [Xenococcus sp. PCC 7305]|nr:hypothetical protein Xen7305DRAFT_00006180 [Xenococcus sp. PCC 7305]
MKYVFHPEALTEYTDAVRYYTEQQTKVAQAFIIYPIEGSYSAAFRIKTS